MLTKMHQRLGTAGFIISIVALVAALGGGAYAASGGLSGKQKKEVEKIAKKYAGKPGATGPAGPAGASGGKGDTGAKGDNGAPGAAGANGAPGAPGAKGETGKTGFTETLPPGETETGAWNIDVSTAGGLSTFTTISFPIPLKAESAEEAAFVFTQEQTENSEFGTSGCTGTVAEPTAPPGVLCVYTQFESSSVTSTYEARSFGGLFEAYGPSGATLQGPTLVGTAGAPAHLEVVGTWAVTAPTA